MADSSAILVLAGGRARRFPGKLEHCVDGAPMVVRVVERLRATGLPVYIAGKGSFPPEIDARIDAPIFVDRHPGKGPLHALISASAAIRTQWIFAVAADQPTLEATVLQGLATLRRPGDEAVIPSHDGTIEPLAALYSRSAILREGYDLAAKGCSAMRDLVGRLYARFVPFDAAYFRNVNAPEDLP